MNALKEEGNLIVKRFSHLYDWLRNGSSVNRRRDAATALKINVIVGY